MKIIETNSRQNLFSWVLYGGLLLFTISLFSKKEFYSISTKGIEHLLLPGIIVFLLGILSLRMILWFIYGKETVSLINNELVLRKQGTFWINKKRTIPKAQIKSIEYYEPFFERMNPYDLARAFYRQVYIFKIQNTGRIKIHFNDSKTLRILDNITDEQANEFLIKIKNVR